jgi:hypothetical protein
MGDHQRHGQRGPFGEEVRGIAGVGEGLRPLQGGHQWSGQWVGVVEALLQLRGGDGRAAADGSGEGSHLGRVSVEFGRIESDQAGSHFAQPGETPCVGSGGRCFLGLACKCVCGGAELGCAGA